MQEQRFEKQVQKKMEELSLTPSAPVWEKVEREIRRKKETRRVIVWALPLALLCGAGIWWLIQSALSVNSTNVAAIESTYNPKEQNAKEKNNHILSTSPSINENQQDNISWHDKKAGDPAVKQNHSNTTEHTNQIQTVIIAKTRLNIERAQRRIATRSFKKNTITNTQQVITKNNPLDLSQQPAEISNSSVATTDISLSKPNTSQIQTEADQNKARYIDTVANTQILEETIATKPTPSEKKANSTRKWSWALQGDYGKSTVKTRLIEGQTAPLSNGNFMSPAVIGNGISYPPASKPQHSGSFSIGFTAKRALNRHFSLVSGLQFSYFSTKISVGSNLSQAEVLQYNFNQASSRYLSAGETKTYKNKYHFIEIPVGVEWKPLKQIPLQFQTGITLSRLLYTNALIYDQSTGIYYIDKEGIDKNQLHVFSNVSYRIIKGKALSLNVGPYIRYGVSGLQKGNLEREGHLLSGGINTTISLNK